MNWFTFHLLILLNIYGSESKRRIKGGHRVASEKSYMVYFIKAPISVKRYDQWLCGGALVSTWFILTAQGCVRDVEHMYAIAGYHKYIPDYGIEIDKCTKEKKKRVVYFCVPEGARFSYDSVLHWAAVDIALAKVDTEYDLNDDSFKKLCSYIPTVIPFNYESRFQEPDTDAIVMGWGHTNRWRLPFDPDNYNQLYLRYAPIKILSNELCKKEYPTLSHAIQQYNMICSMEAGELDEAGKFNITVPSAKLQGCKPDLRTENCSLNIARDKTAVVSEKESSEEHWISKIEKVVLHSREKISNGSSGFCQNDHGGPLVAWVGSRQVIIGIATAFKVTDDSKCNGPYLFTSTASHAMFLDCVLKQNLTAKRMRKCENRPIGRGYKIFEKYISWTDPPVKPVENETLATVKASVTLNNQTTTTEKLSEAFKELIKPAENETLATVNASVIPNNQTTTTEKLSEAFKELIKYFGENTFQAITKPLL